MDRTEWRALGLILGGAAGVGLGFLARALASHGFWVELALTAGAIVVVLVLYLVANSSPAPTLGRTGLLTGMLLGFNAGLSSILILALLGPIAALIIGVVLALAFIAPLARRQPYQFFLGWSNFISPLSWIVSGLGTAFFLVSLLLHAVTGGKVQFLKINKVSADWPTGTFFMVGGLAGNGNLSPGSTGFNMGTFAFLKGSAGLDPYLIEHESGHTLNLAAFGFVYHFIGAIDENLTGGGANAFSELCAESHVPPTMPGRRSYLPLWNS
jgi:hypothetical protein